MISIFIETSVKASAEPARRVVGLPATIGRGLDCTVRLGADIKAISRNHLEVVEESGRAVVINRGSNPGTSRHGGRVLAVGERLPIAPGSSLTVDVLDHAVTVGYAGALLLNIHDGDAAPVSFDLAPGMAVAVAIGPEGRRIERIVPETWHPPGTGVVLVLFLDRGQPACARIGAPEAAPIRIDHALSSGVTAWLRPTEAVLFEGFRCEIVEVGRPVVRCPDPACATLSEVGRNTCRVCGTRLVPAAALAAPAAPEAETGTPAPAAIA